MFYLLVGLLLALYYIVAAPKTIKGTLNTVLVVGVIALLLVFGLLGMIKLIQSPPEFFVGFLMIGFGGLVLKDVMTLTTKNKGTSKPSDDQMA